MVFDEPTSALDAKSIEMLFSYLHKIKRDKIIIVITHDEAVKGCCDEVMEVDKCCQPALISKKICNKIRL